MIESTWSKTLSMDVKEAIEETSQQLRILLKEKQFEAIFTFCSGHDVLCLCQLDLVNLLYT